MIIGAWRWSFQGETQVLCLGPPREAVSVEVTIVLTNNRIALMGVPGEPSVDFQISWRGRCPVRDAFFVGYNNGYYDYFPTMRAASEGGTAQQIRIRTLR